MISPSRCTRPLRLASALALGFALASPAPAETTSLTMGPVTKGTSNTPVTMLFPVSRTGDKSYDAVMAYHTFNGSAHGGVDYVMTSGNITIPAGSNGVVIPVTLAAHASSGADQTLQMYLEAASGVGPPVGFGAQQAFAAGSTPYSVAAVDVNGDGKVDLVVANSDDDTVSVMRNTAASNASASFSTAQNFATGSGPASVTTADVNGDGKADLIVANFMGNTVSVLLNTTTPGANTLAFSLAETFTTGGFPVSVTTADINGDGMPDVIVANQASNTVSVLLNTTLPGAGTPSFAAQSTFATGSGPRSVVAADVNGDGKVDLVVANYGATTISVLRNATTPGAATPAFSPQDILNVGTHPLGVAVADINGDGKPDLIATTPDNDTVSVLLNRTDPSMGFLDIASAQTFATGDGPSYVFAADVNGDGKQDLIVTCTFAISVSVLLNTTPPGTLVPSFAEQQTFATGPFPYSGIAANVNGDGKPDIVVASSSDGTVSVLLNSTARGGAAAGFATQQTIATGSWPSFVRAVDVNGDGKRDMIYANYDDHSVSVRLNTTTPAAATPSFGAPQTFATPFHPTAVAATDINGDGRADLIVATVDSNKTVAVLLNTTAPGATVPSFATQQTFGVGSGPRDVAAADVNGDGKPDLVVVNNYDSTISVRMNTTVPGSTAAFAAQQTFAAGSHPVAVALADLDGDGKPDVVVANYDGASVVVLHNITSTGAASASFATQQIFDAELYPSSVATADVNGDGKPDLIAANNGSGTISVLMNNTAPGAVIPTFAAQVTFDMGSGPASVTAADLDGDGKADIIATNYADHALSVRLNATVVGDTTPDFAERHTYATESGPASVAAADVNGDGKPDLLVANNGGNSVSVLLNTQYLAAVAGSPATGTIAHDYVFAAGFE